MKLPFIKYYESGYSVLWTINETGGSGEEDWGRWSSEIQDAAMIESWEEQYKLPKYGIGIICGKQSGIIGVDIDSDSKDILDLFPKSRVSKIGSKGETRFFRYNGYIKSSARRKNIGPNRQFESYEGFDILTDRRMTIIPPSINRKNHREYYWSSQETLLDVRPDDLEYIDASIIKRAEDYVNSFSIDGKASSGGRNDQLTKVACAIYHAYPEFTVEEMADKLLSYDIENHSPRTYFADPKEPECRASRGNAYEAAKRFAARHKKQLEKKVIKPSPVQRDMKDVWTKLGVTQTKKGPVSNYDAIVKVVSGVPAIADAFWYDEFLCNIITTWGGGSPRPFCDVDAMSVQQFAQGKIGLSTINYSSVYNAIVQHSRARVKNEVKEWLAALPEWDGLHRVETLFPAYFGSDNNEYTQAVGRNFMISLIARAINPGCKVDTMVILEGEQGILKSTSLRTLISDKWFGELTVDIAEKDAILSIQGKWLIEVPELDALVRAESETIKRALSTQVDRLRVPYGRSIEAFPRQCVFAGTTNADGYLKDHTGGRRFWPIRCQKILLDMLAKDREQLFSEALGLYKSGAPWYDVPADLAAAEVEDRTIEVDAWLTHIDAWLETAETTINPITIFRVLNECLGIEISKITPYTQHRASRVLSYLGYKRKKTKKLRFYVKE